MPLRYYNSNDEDTERMDRTQSYAQATRPWPAHPQSQSGNGPQSTAPHDPRATQDPPGPLHYAPKGYKAHLATDYVAPRAYATAAPAQQSAQRRPVGPPEHQPLETYRKTEGAKSDPGFLKELKNGVKSMFQTRKEKGSKKKDPPVMPPPANARGAPLNGAPPGGAPARAGPPSQRQQPMAGVERRQPPPKVPQANPPPAGHPAPPSGTAEEGPRDRREARHPSQSDAKEQDARRQSYAKPQEPLPPTASRPEPAEDDDPFPALRRYELEFMEPYDDYSDEAGYSEDEADWDCEGYGDRRHEVGYGALPPPPQRPPKLYFGDRRGDEDPREGAGHEPAWPGRQPHDGAHRGSAGAGPPPYGAPVGRLPHDDPRG
eukprot:CAMPEP_0174295146 /NCGR_PEP_ID=MMETSP0809-20121228/43784_1 /TAXON_ID=73025 ORGANISM="Eutreptiella gymnastica-like, Strain CCMP1594" /NCGR_SAMPLE_ID=MMETSP0809 /ASSEMBLY_ACC=CAM_ASM_000658 /LENGTH=373 /DNA_ID=CAMNT_0015397161 /DNA_START=30 /DNA_END=1148 /DNA_ORIENTATION=+